MKQAVRPNISPDRKAKKRQNEVKPAQIMDTHDNVFTR